MAGGPGPGDNGPGVRDSLGKAGAIEKGQSRGRI